MDFLGKSLAELSIDIDTYGKHIISEEDKSWGCYLFVKRDEQSFEFKCVCTVAQGSSGETYEVLFHGQAYFDGVRHLYFGSEDTDNYGYHYYPNLKSLTAALTKLSEIESELDYVKQERK
ncbi:MAG: hypothetical protein HY226_06770 [Candidatus Vogelbacteria bacterium]|nr:hypothetical protein [Candidatus Vogelbacteria bacterium]